MRYCIIRHVGFLIGHGHPAGDSTVRPQTVEEVVRLLKRPAPDVGAMESTFRRLTTLSEPMAIPLPESEAEGDVFDALAILFVEPRKAENARSAIKKALGEAFFELVTAYLAFIRTAHYWTETHPELACETDILQMVSDYPELGALLLDTEEAERIRSGDMLRQALNQSEDKYRAIFTSINEGFALCETVLNDAGQPVDIRLLESNPSFEKIMGIDLQTTKERTLRQLLPDTDETWIQAVSTAALTRKTVEFDRRLTVPDRWFCGYAAPAGGRMGNHLFVLLITDITQRKWLEQQKEDFLSIASHELKTPITSIKAYGQLLELELGENKKVENNLLVRKMNAQVNRLNDLISDLLDTTKITEGQLRLDYDQFAIERHQIFTGWRTSRR